MSDHNHKIEARRRDGHKGVNGWMALVDGVALRGPKGRIRSFKSEEAAFGAADFDAWLRDQ